MRLANDEICAMHKVQEEILINFIHVCECLDLTYYMVHGSLLGTVRCKGFFPFDDDIDVAMPRKDYNKLLSEGQKFLPDNMYIQSCQIEHRFPMAFAKIRDSQTAFIQHFMLGFDINQGIYIDIFPIDYYPKSAFMRKRLSLLESIYKARIGYELLYESKQPAWKSFLRGISRIICPSWDKAVQKRAALYSNIPTGNSVIVIGGKAKERGISRDLFGEGLLLPFESIQVKCPSKYREYLTCIYGDYMHYDPAAAYMNEDGTVTVSADIFSTEDSYKSFFRK